MLSKEVPLFYEYTAASSSLDWKSPKRLTACAHLISTKSTKNTYFDNLTLNVLNKRESPSNLFQMETKATIAATCLDFSQSSFQEAFSIEVLEPPLVGALAPEEEVVNLRGFARDE